MLKGTLSKPKLKISNTSNKIIMVVIIYATILTIVNTLAIHLWGLWK